MDVNDEGMIDFESDEKIKYSDLTESSQGVVIIEGQEFKVGDLDASGMVGEEYRLVSLDQILPQLMDILKNSEKTSDGYINWNTVKTYFQAILNPVLTESDKGYTQKNMYQKNNRGILWLSESSQIFKHITKTTIKIQ